MRRGRSSSDIVSSMTFLLATLVSTCRALSQNDNEARRRVWKMTLRTEESREEKVCQAEYDLGGATDEAAGRGGEGDEEDGDAADATDNGDDDDE